MVTHAPNNYGKKTPSRLAPLEQLYRFPRLIPGFLYHRVSIEDNSSLSCHDSLPVRHVYGFLGEGKGAEVGLSGYKIRVGLMLGHLIP